MFTILSDEKLRELVDEGLVFPEVLDDEDLIILQRDTAEYQKKHTLQQVAELLRENKICTTHEGLPKIATVTFTIPLGVWEEIGSG